MARKYLKKEASNNCFNLTIPVVMVCAVASLGTNHAKPFGPELQVKQMLDGRRLRGAKKEDNDGRKDKRDYYFMC